MNTEVRVELDRWDERKNLRPASLEDGSQVSIGLRTTGDNKISLDRTIQLGKYAFRVFVTELRGETFLLRATMAIRKNERKKRDGVYLRERPLKPFYDDAGIIHWPVDRTGVFAGFPVLWDDLWAHYFIRETLDVIRSPEIPEYYELYQDNSEEE